MTTTSEPFHETASKTKFRLDTIHYRGDIAVFWDGEEIKEGEYYVTISELTKLLKTTLNYAVPYEFIGRESTIASEMCENALCHDPSTEEYGDMPFMLSDAVDEIEYSDEYWEKKGL